MDIPMNKGLETIEKMRTHVNRFYGLAEKCTPELMPTIMILKGISDSLKIIGQDEESENIIKTGEKMSEYVSDVFESCMIIISDINEFITAENDYKKQIVKAIEEIKEDVRK
jgi:hypothetical protein